MAIDRDVAITWLGHATFVIRTPGGKTVIIDPWLEGNPACPPERQRVEACDLVLVTHAHSDHMGSVIPVARSTGAMVIAQVELADWFSSKGLSKVTGMNKGGTVWHEGISITLVHAFHSSSIEDGGKTFYGGEAAGYVVKLENGFTFYHAGDTDVFGDMALIAELYGPELAMLPIGGHFTMAPFQAAKAVRLLKPRHVLPMHYGTFPILSGTPDELRELTQDIEGLTVHSPAPGETLI